MKKRKEIIRTLATGSLMVFVVVGLLGGWVFLFGNSKTDTAIHDTICAAKGGTLVWKDWPHGCGEGDRNHECSFLTCNIPSNKK